MVHVFGVRLVKGTKLMGFGARVEQDASSARTCARKMRQLMLCYKVLVQREVRCRLTQLRMPRSPSAAPRLGFSTCYKSGRAMKVMMHHPIHPACITRTGLKLSNERAFLDLGEELLITDSTVLISPSGPCVL